MVNVLLLCLLLVEPRAERVVVEFGAEWCGPCKQMAPHWKHQEVKDILLTDYTDTYVVDIDKDPASKQRFKVTSIPAVVILEKRPDGKWVEVKRNVGAISREQLKRFLKR